ncbi:MAG: hypothetical protein NVS1B2_04810 [Vulcanimicrobiaceae bacterium]
MYQSSSRAYAALVFACVVTSAPLSARAATEAGRIAGVVTDSASGLAVSGASVRVIGAAGAATTDRSGAFVLDGVAPGAARLRVTGVGLAPTESDSVVVRAGANVAVTLAVGRTTSSSLRTIATTATTAATALQRSSTSYRTLAPDALVGRGTVRFGDALRDLPGISNSIAGDTAALGDDLQLQIRGLGATETTSLLDGHPIGFGVPGGFNYQLSPSFGLKSVTVTYGSAGTELSGYDAIGGTVDARTLDPTRDHRLSIAQGLGSFARAATSLTATGPLGARAGYAFGYGAANVDGALDHQYPYQPGAAFDPSATSPAVRSLATYRDDSSAVTHSALAKLRYDLSAATSLTFSTVASSYWEDKTGNGDTDYLSPTVALAQGSNLLAAKNPTDACPGDSFTATNANGTPWGTGPGGVPDGGSPCQTPQSYASHIAGLQGAGPAWQSFAFDDYALHLRSNGSRRAFAFDAFTNRYRNAIDRTFLLPFVAVPGDSGFSLTTNAVATGLAASETFAGTNNDLAAGFEYTNYAYALTHNGALQGAPIVRETNVFVRDTYHPHASPLALSAVANVKSATATHASYLDPRFSAVYTFPGARDVVRAAIGATTTQPTAELLGQRFTPQALLSAGGGGGLSCTGINAIGNAPSSVLRPERGVDREFAIAHRFGGDSQIQLALYDTDVSGKIYNALTPLSRTGTDFVDAATLSSARSTLAAQCGNVDPLAHLGVAGSVNIGALRARGFTIGGRQRLDRRLYIDYDYATTSTVVRSVAPEFLQQNLTVVPGSQVPRVPLHTFDVAADALLAPAIDLRLTLHGVSENNTKRLPAYHTTDLRIDAAALGGTFTVAVTNLFDQHAFIEGYLGEGQPLALNGYATPDQYAPFTGAAATERFGLPFRSVYINYAFAIR